MVAEMNRDKCVRNSIERNHLLSVLASNKWQNAQPNYYSPLKMTHNFLSSRRITRFGTFALLGSCYSSNMIDCSEIRASFCLNILSYVNNCEFALQMLSKKKTVCSPWVCHEFWTVPTGSGCSLRDSGSWMGDFFWGTYALLSLIRKDLAFESNI